MEQINLYEILKFYTCKWRLIIAITLLGVVAGIIYNNFIQVPEYKSNSKLLLISSQGTQVTTTNQILINNYISLIKSHRVLDPVIEKQQNNISYDELFKSIVVSNEKDTAFIDIAVSTPSAERSASIANQTTDSFKNAASALYQKNDVTTVDPAVKTTSPSNVHQAIQLSITTVVGFLISLIVVFIKFDYLRSHPVVIKTNTVKKTPVLKRLSKFVTIDAKPRLKNNANKKPSVKTSAKNTATITKNVIKKPTSKPVTKKKTSANTRKY